MRDVLVLASSSPRRIDLMKQVGFNPRVMSPDTDETRLKGEHPRGMVGRLAREKAEAVGAELLGQGLGGDRALIIAADTTVVAPDGKTVLAKPRNAAEARRMLGQLSGKTHTVFTGYCVLGLKPPRASRSGSSGAPVAIESHVLVRVVASKVKFRKLSAPVIARYVASGEPMDKAGAYGAQGMGMALIEGITGSYTNVVGLPMSQLLADLEEKFGVALFK